MLKKLFKHDFRGLGRVLWPLQIGVLAGTLLATGLFSLMMRTSNLSQIGLSGGLFMLLGGIIVFLIGMAVACSFLATLIIVCAHFYRNFLEDEGYLTFTLPVTPAQLLWSKLLTGMLWLLISLVTICVSGVIFVSFGTVSQGVMNMDVLKFFKAGFESLGQLNQSISVLLVTIELLVMGLSVVAAQLLEIDFSILVGGQIAKKHKVLAGIGMYLVINLAVGILVNILTLCGWGLGGLDMLFSGQWTVQRLFHYTVLIATVISLMLSAGFFLWSRYLMKNKLNLQ